MSSEPFSTVLSLPRPDHPANEANFVLLHVESTGRRQLDLKLIGTEEETVFSVALRHSKISDLKSTNSPCNQDDWEDILLSIFRGIAPGNGDILQGIETIAKVERKAVSLTVIIQKRIEGITQKLGTISLPATDDEPVSLFEWCGNVIKSKETASNELHIIQKRMEEKDAQIKKLEEGMDELVKLKTSHESALLEKFSILLNEKKLKIRDQQRLLSASNIDPEKLEEVARSRDSRSRSAGPSRSGKRKLAVKDDESDDGFEKMEVEEEADVLNDSDGEGRRTPEPDLTASEDSDDEPVPPPIRKTAHSQEMNEPPSSAAEVKKEDFVPPPRRELPFQHKKAAANEAPVDNGSDTESDDEL
ncbi:hypothetical protein GLAREA_09281 [Glarea lozoyensis ATCC 20868]|uniref:Mitotic apparatus protein p62 n=1 Tax=Glarea lozoyensis (strain ATCC 20868 / MF5171) TaxID=1116229 RepID=S3EG08_GLAL2|nr:uncharacterized protein GLAREA_09281 [Glarea lozoyensis ATCC 20868]EPE37118.1 hypothetical protein GLAREA_09281 [Glarea lozoyensis ATCC 20868]